MNHDAIQDLRDALLRRALTAEEQHRLEAWLAAHPEAAAAWREDERLARALLQQRARTPALPASFTDRVMAEIRRESERPERAERPARADGPGTSWWMPWQRWISLAAAALVLVSAITVWEKRNARADAEFARQVSALRFIADLPSGMLQDYEAIQRFGDSTPPVDYELLAALQ